MSPTRNSHSSTAARVIVIVADVMAAILGLWILMYLLDANRANDLVQFIHDVARWLAGWSHDLFTFDEDWARVVAGYGLAAIVYLLVGHALAGRLRRY
ncbi:MULTISPECIES: hypothetical protein [Streptomyces]|uniref:Uncharacterized protein n=1 Tax=Streptomyces venezuelae TaxID=54571 RepID=A0A5P2BCF0_STRVZ|nr:MULTISPECIES: hypothetical protein [Streptomyces]NEA06531.1 hypothetical protein [Streptomyces sp. SID10116]MYY85511.1 hypothetical protein [Streptomyces sp. SID335]MYZ12674.1 hypothetical protein [Streptomyces sp. SID337]NDZ91701.1 hypothetical protein [Streptomyces sp. SID10115]NEB47679.1 hypothetical protein [Streptomyces sp. SID339]